MTVGAQVLPNELVCAIVEHCRTEDLAALCLVSSAVQTWARPLLYRSVDLPARPQVVPFLLACRSTGIGAHTLRLSLGSRVPLEPTELAELLSHLSQLTRLRASVFSLPPSAPSLTHFYASGELSIVSWLRAVPQPSITHLFLEDPYCVGKPGLSRLDALFPCLTHAAFSTRPIHGGHLAAFLRMPWLELPNVRRVVAVVVFVDQQHREAGWEDMLVEIRTRVRDERAYVCPVDAAELVPGIEEVDSPTRRTRMAADALGREAFRGNFDLWNIGTCLGPPE
ncbi:hypothetical protein AURDEDRAFT_126435 [Auricularia subglabra TFB-10046 SS5]|nr:hypothetical protein AURDEDRAFT_126435 [Auricularia subglabra TFB-10046 SS5]